MTHPLVEDNVYKAKPILVKALRFGVDVGRLRLGKPGNVKCQTEMAWIVILLYLR